MKTTDRIKLVDSVLKIAVVLVTGLAGVWILVGEGRGYACFLLLAIVLYLLLPTRAGILTPLKEINETKAGSIYVFQWLCFSVATSMLVFLVLANVFEPAASANGLRMLHQNATQNPAVAKVAVIGLDTNAVYLTSSSPPIQPQSNVPLERKIGKTAFFFEFRSMEVSLSALTRQLLRDAASWAGAVGVLATLGLLIAFGLEFAFLPTTNDKSHQP